MQPELLLFKIFARSAPTLGISKWMIQPEQTAFVEYLEK